jgi:hypothetical protein
MVLRTCMSHEDKTGHRPEQSKHGRDFLEPDHRKRWQYAAVSARHLHSSHSNRTVHTAQLLLTALSKTSDAILLLSENNSMFFFG